MSIITLALDLGSKTGWSITDGGSGTWVLCSEKELAAARLAGEDRTLDPRIPSLEKHIRQAFHEHSITRVVFEDVKFASTSMQAHLWASFRTVVWMACHERGISPIAIPVQTLKVAAASHGGATKEMMATALAKRLPREFSVGPDWKCWKPSAVIRDFIFVDDNEVDARLLRYLVEHQPQFIPCPKPKKTKSKTQPRQAPSPPSSGLPAHLRKSRKSVRSAA